MATGGNATEAAARVYNSKGRHVAQSIGSENLSKPIIQREIVAVYLQAGIDDMHVARKLAAMLDSEDEKIIMDAIKEYNRVMGHQAPSQSRSLHVTATLEDIIDAQRRKNIAPQSE